MTMRTLQGEHALLRIFIGERDRWHGKPLFRAIVEKLRAAGLSGATVLRGIEGFGAHSVIHSTSILQLSQDLPLVIEVVDAMDRIEGVLPALDGMVTEGMVTLEKVTVVKYASGEPPAPPAPPAERSER